MINEYTYQFLQKEIDFFEKYNEAEDTDFIIENLKKLQYQTVNNADSCILRMAYGSGFYGITGDWKFDNHLDTIERPDIIQKGRNRTEEVRYKSRKITGKNNSSALMGFVKLHLPEDVPRINFSRKKQVALPKTPIQETQKEEKQPAVNIPKAAIETPKKTIPSFKTKDFNTLGKNATIYAKITALKRPHSTVELLLDNYKFDVTAKMSGAKKAEKEGVKTGDVVKVIVNSQSSEGQINMVKYISK